jgi:hypothetical protein
MPVGLPQRPLLRVLLVAVLPALFVYVLALVLSAAAGIRTQLVIRDLAQSCDTALGVGFLSSVGYLLWISAAAIALFGALSGVVAVRGRVRQLLLCGGGFCCCSASTTCSYCTTATSAAVFCTACTQSLRC